jgi:co-chaperonin GroES (HSP10)
MEKIQPINSLVAIRIPYLTREKVTHGSLTIDLSVSNKVEEQNVAITYGEVLALPATMKDIHNHGVESEMNVKEGDLVYFDRMYSAEQGEKSSRSQEPTYQFLHEDEKGKVLLIPYRAIILIDRKGELLSCNDFLVGERVNMPKHELELEVKPYKDRIKVIAKPPSFTRYKSETLPSPRLEVGEIAICAQNTVIPLHDQYEQKPLYRVRVRQIVGKE